MFSIYNLGYKLGSVRYGPRSKTTAWKCVGCAGTRVSAEKTGFLSDYSAASRVPTIHNAVLTVGPKFFLWLSPGEWLKTSARPGALNYFEKKYTQQLNCSGKIRKNIFLKFSVRTQVKFVKIFLKWMYCNKKIFLNDCYCYNNTYVVHEILQLQCYLRMISPLTKMFFLS